MADIPIPRELVERAASALEDSVDMVRNDYATNWRHGIPTRAAQLESLRRSVEAHESALAYLRSALSQPHTERAEAVAWMDPQTLDVIHADRKRAWEADYGAGGKAKAATYTMPLVHPPATPPSPLEEPAMPCGHHPSLMLHSAETGEPLYCELCDAASGRRDAERRESELSEANRVLREKLSATQPAWPMKDHELRELVNTLRDVAIKYHATQQLRERIAQVVHPWARPATQPEGQEAPDHFIDVNKMVLDAARYRFLRDNEYASWRPYSLRAGYSATEADALVDAAMSAQAGGGK